MNKCLRGLEIGGEGKVGMSSCQCMVYSITCLSTVCNECRENEMLLVEKQNKIGRMFVVKVLFDIYGCLHPLPQCNRSPVPE